MVKDVIVVIHDCSEMFHVIFITEFIKRGWFGGRKPFLTALDSTDCIVAAIPLANQSHHAAGGDIIQAYTYLAKRVGFVTVQ